MRLKSSKPASQISFRLIAVVVVMGLALLIGTYWPMLKDLQDNQSDRVLALAANSDNQQKLTLLEQAFLLNPGDPRVTEALAGYYKSEGEYDKAFETYERSRAGINYVYLGRLAMKTGQYEQAKIYFSKAVSQEESAESLSGLAMANFALNNTKQGCEEASKAERLNLSSPSAKEASEICKILQNTSKLPKRVQIYKLAEAYIYDQALSQFEAYNPKGTGDWVAMAQIYQNKNQKQKALEAIKSGIAQDPTSVDLMQRATALLNSMGRGVEAEIYKPRLQELEFKNYQ